LEINSPVLIAKKRLKAGFIKEMRRYTFVTHAGTREGNNKP